MCNLLFHVPPDKQKVGIKIFFLLAVAPPLITRLGFHRRLWLSSTLEIINTVTVIAFRLQFNQNMSIKTTAVTDVYI